MERLTLLLTEEDILLANARWKGWAAVAPEHAPSLIADINALLWRSHWRIVDIKQAKTLARESRFVTDYAFLVKNDHPLYRKYVGEAVEPPRVSPQELSAFVEANPDIRLEDLPPDSPYGDSRFRRRTVVVPGQD
jgi:hypothetical protein